jgi:hypothetical protein
MPNKLFEVRNTRAVVIKDTSILSELYDAFQNMGKKPEEIVVEEGAGKPLEFTQDGKLVIRDAELAAVVREIQEEQNNCSLYAENPNSADRKAKPLKQGKPGGLVPKKPPQGVAGPPDTMCPCP